MSITNAEMRQKLTAKGWTLQSESTTRECWHCEYGNIFLHDDGTPLAMVDWKYGELEPLCEFAAIAGIQPQGYVLTEAERQAINHVLLMLVLRQNLSPDEYREQCIDSLRGLMNRSGSTVVTVEKIPEPREEA